MRATDTLRTALAAILEEEGLAWPVKTVIEPPDVYKRQGLVVAFALKAIGGLLIFSLIVTPAATALQLTYSLLRMFIPVSYTHLSLRLGPPPARAGGPNAGRRKASMPGKADALTLQMCIRDSRQRVIRAR